MCDIPQMISDASTAVGNFFSSSPTPSGFSDALSNTVSGADVAAGTFDAASAGAGAGGGITTTALSALDGSIPTSSAAFGDAGAGASAIVPGVTFGGGGSPVTSSVGMGGGAGLGATPVSQIASGTPSIASSPIGAAGGGSGVISTLGSDLGGNLPNLNAPDTGTTNLGGLGDISKLGAGGAGNAAAGMTAGATGATPAEGGGVPDAIKNFAGLDSLKAKDLIGPALATGGLALTASKPQTLPFTNQLQGSADALAGQGSALTAGLQTGTLPAGAQASLDEAAAAQKAHIRSQYAGMNLSGSTMEQAALANVDSQIEGQKFQQIMQLVNTGLGETSAANQIYQALQKDQLTQDASLSDSISKFAAALAGGGKSTVNVNTG